MNEKVIYPIAKKRVVGATRITDTNYKFLLDGISKRDNWINNLDLALWTLTTNDYIVQGDAYTRKISAGDNDYFCFICY